MEMVGLMLMDVIKEKNFITNKLSLYTQLKNLQIKRL